MLYTADSGRTSTSMGQDSITLDTYHQGLLTFPTANVNMSNDMTSVSTPSTSECSAPGSPIVLTSSLSDPVLQSQTVFANAVDVAVNLCPSRPVTIARPNAACRAAQFFVKHFPGTPMFAVKANPSKELVQLQYSQGIHQYDCASIQEIRLVNEAAPNATMCYMHPVKAPESIHEAYFQYNIKTFSLDCMEELEKIMACTNNATDLTLCVRLRVSSHYAKLALGAKFGVADEEAEELLHAVRMVAQRTGLCFHVGSQTTEPAAYLDALDLCAKLIAKTQIKVDIIDVGGGFPSRYNSTENIPSMHKFFDAVREGISQLPLDLSTTTVWAEPGRSLCNEFNSIVVRVDKRRKNQLYINDGSYGSLFDATHCAWSYPMRVIAKFTAFLQQPSPYNQLAEEETSEFAMWGPTCDDIDNMPGPFPLPTHTGLGDYIEIGMIGAYGSCMRTLFNGFGTGHTVYCLDNPVYTMYSDL